MSAAVAMQPDRAQDLIRRYEGLRNGRGVWENHWREIAERIRPTHNQFQRTNVPGQKQTDKIFDATAALALERFGAAMESMLTPRTQTWHKLRPIESKLAEDLEVMRWCDEVTRILFSVRYSPRANFASQAHECYMDIGAFGSSSMFVEDVVGQMIRYKSIPLSQSYFVENHAGVVDTVFRAIKFQTHQAVSQFGPKCPPKIRERLEKEPDREWDFVHVVHPNDSMQRGRRDYKGMAFYSCYIWLEGRVIVDEGGFRKFPFCIGRYATAPNEIYGRGPAMIILPDIKMLNEMGKTIIRAAQRIVDPPLLLANDGALSAFALRPGALNYGYLSDGGEPLVRALETKGDIQLGSELLEQKRKTINDAFLVTLFQILVDTPTMTATEALMRAQEKGALLAPTMGRQQSEFLGPLIEREIDILTMAGVLPPPPQQLLDSGGIDIEYVSPLNHAQRADEGVAILRWLDALTPMAQIDPSVLEVVDVEQTARSLADIYGVGAKNIRSPEVMAAMAAQKKQQAELANMVQAAPALAGSIKDLAAAQAQGGGAPNNVAAALGQ